MPDASTAIPSNVHLHRILLQQIAAFAGASYHNQLCVFEQGFRNLQGGFAANAHAGLQTLVRTG